MIRSFVLAALIAAVPLAAASAQSDQNLKALIVDGQNNHKNWPDTTKMMKKYLEDTKRFTVEIATTAPRGNDPSFKPEFKKYAVVISNYNGEAWPKETQEAFVAYMTGGGGFAC